MPEPICDLKCLGISEQKAKETVKNPQLTNLLISIVEQARSEDASILGTPSASLLYQVGTRLKPQFQKYRQYLVSQVCRKNLKSEAQVSAALEFIAHRTVSGFTDAEFEDACGIGVEVTPDEIERVVEQVMVKHRDQIIQDRYRFNTGKVVGEIRQSLKWADGKVLKNEIDLQMVNLLGPKTSDDLTPLPKKSGKDKGVASTPKKKEKISDRKIEAPQGGDATDENLSILEIMKRLPQHKPGENYRTDGYVTTPKTKELLEKHLKETGGKVVTRFPPEPNGVLHLGHAKAINVDFGYAKAHGGICYLRFDDTNPEKEDEFFVRSIEEAVQWLGYKPYRMTHSSDYFDQLYKFAIKLIKSGDAYVCHQRTEEIKGFNPPPSPYRDRSIAENLSLFEDMKNGLFNEGEATLRMKVTLEEGKVDPVAYRIKFVPHHRSGDKWCIYPTYDYTHCICDSLENISHSLCTKEFQNRRSSYYWLCNKLEIYCPVQWEYGRLCMNYTVTSKRKIQKLIENGIVSGYDDPRLFTLIALRRRGFPAEAVNAFVARMGVSLAQTYADPAMIEATVRDVLNAGAPRAMAVLEPLDVEIVGGDVPTEVSVPDFPPDFGKDGRHTVAFGKRLWIDASDFKETAEKGYKRLTPSQPVGLKHVNLVLSVTEVVKSGDKLKLKATVAAPTAETKPKGFIQWVADPIRCEVRLYNRLFIHKNPEDADEVPGGFLSDVNPNSLEVVRNAMVDKSVANAKSYECFQFERIGYFSVDPDSKPGKMVFNRTVLLKEDSGKL